MAAFDDPATESPRPLPPLDMLPPPADAHLHRARQNLASLFPDREAQLHALQAASTAAVALRNIACVAQNHVLLLDLPCLRLWAACMDAARQQEAPERTGAYASVASAVLHMISACLAPRMLLAAFGQDGLHLVCSLLRLLAPMQHPHLPLVLVEAAAEALAAIASAFPPNTDTVLQLSGVAAAQEGGPERAPGPLGAPLAAALADLLILPYALIRCARACGRAFGRAIP